MLAITLFLVSAMESLRGAVRRDEGQTMAEYGLILAGIAVIVMAAVFLLGEQIDTVFGSITDQFS